jgi:bifunctional DNase/RNase
MYEVEVWGIAVDPFNQSPIVVLRNKENPKEVLPIWIGHPEASGIMMVLNNVEFERPLTYELLKNILDSLKVTVEKIEISDLKNGTFYATLYLKTPEGEIKAIDSRPSDAINIALRTGAPIYVADHVMDKSKVIVEEPPALEVQKEEDNSKGEIAKPTEKNEDEKTELPKEEGEQKPVIDEELKRWIENLKPEDFQKFGRSQ